MPLNFCDIRTFYEVDSGESLIKKTLTSLDSNHIIQEKKN